LDRRRHFPAASFINRYSEANLMLRWALIFLVLALVAGALGAGGVAGLSMNIAYVLFVVFLVLMVISFFTGGFRGRGTRI
jgi:uncharacterized membrane protein YtjA (UPF0391 family)